MSIGFKEWTLVCDALERGEQSIILRKGGIAEGRAGFRFQHEEFLLFPTLFHEQVSKLKLPPETPLPPRPADGQIEIRCTARVEWTTEITDLAVAMRLAPLHLWRDAVVEERFHYEEKQGAGISLAFVRIARLPQPFVFADSPRFGGCRSWVNLPDVPPGGPWENVIDDSTHRDREDQLRALLRQ